MSCNVYVIKYYYILKYSILKTGRKKKKRKGKLTNIFYITVPNQINPFVLMKTIEGFTKKKIIRWKIALEVPIIGIIVL